MNTSEKIKVMQAFGRGEDIVSRINGAKAWVHNFAPQWDWLNTEYRVMRTNPPAPQFIYVGIDQLGNSFKSVISTDSNYRFSQARTARYIFDGFED